MEHKMLLEQLHNNPSALRRWFLRPLMLGVVGCIAFFSIGAFLKWRGHLPMHITRWILMSVLFIAWTILPTLYRLSAYERTMKRLK